MKNNSQKITFYLYLDRLNALLQQQEDFIWQRHEYMLQNEFERARILEEKYKKTIEDKIKALSKILLEEINHE